MMQVRPSVVTIMGHVDHGKTTFLDKIRKSNVASKEVGQITQAIGASQVILKDKKITFLDTPGHEAFVKMRSRGAKVADLAVLVVAADDGVMPQTKESIKIIRQTKTPFLVAINKIDLPGASIDKVKGQLAENEVFVEGYGGDVVAVPISAKTGQGIDQLLEMVLLLAEMEELKADPQGDFEGVVIESKKDRSCGPIATILVKNGTLKIGDFLVCEGVGGKVKSMKDAEGKHLQVAEISQPVQVLGFEAVPPAGARVTVSFLPFQEKPVAPKKEEGIKKVEKGERLRIILRADSVGSLEAILGTLPPEVKVILKEVGDVCESDVLLARTFSAIIFGFNVKIPASVAKLAEIEKVKIKNFQIIYDLLKDVEETVLKIMEPTIDREILGKAEIIAEFEIKRERIAGAKVIQGRINKTDKICLERNKEIIGETAIKSMKHGKGEITQADSGQEFGAVFTPMIDFQKGDVIIAYIINE